MKNKFFLTIKKFFSPFTSSHKFIMLRFSKNIRLQLIGVFIVCMISSIIIGVVTSHLLQINDQNLKTPNNMNLKKTSNPAIEVANEIEKNKFSIRDTQKINKLMQSMGLDKNYKNIICDLQGKILYKSNNVNETKVNINTLIKSYINAVGRSSVTMRRFEYEYSLFSFYPVKFTDGEGFIAIRYGISKKIMFSDINVDTRLLPMIVAIISFVVLFFLFTNKKMKYIKFVSAGLFEISKGNLDYKIKRQGEDELALLADNINYMAEELKNKIENERKADRIKTELITNVSHDLRTPLTSIKGYLELIKRKEYKEQIQLEQYVSIVYNKAEKLELLVNDLFEYTKLINNAVPVEKQEIVINELLEQLIEEFVPTCEEHNVTMSKDFVKEKLTVNLDPNKTVRVFENLLINAIRYSIKPSDIKISLIKEGQSLIISIKNSCNPIAKKDLEKIFERFYRLEKSRSSDTGGSGLGLAIAKGMVEIQGGTIEVESKGNLINFIVKFKC